MTWGTKALAEVCEIKPRKGEAKEKLADTDLVSFVPMEDLGIDQKFLEPKVERKLDQVAGSYTYFADGDVLLAKITPCFENGKLGIAKGLTNGIGFGSSEYIVFRPNERLSNEYLYYFLLQDSFRAEGISTMSGAVGHKRVSKEFIERCQIPLPPLSEQQRIVAILDEALARLAAATTNAKKNLNNARELFDSVSEALLQARDETWQRLTLEVLLERGWIVSHLDGNHGNDYPRKEEFISSGVPYLSANCLEGDTVDMSLAKFLSPERAALLRKGIAQNGDILFAHNATVGPVAMLYTDEPKVILSTSLTYYRCHPDHIVPEYLAHYMRSPEFRAQYEAVMRQSTRNQVPITKQREFFHVLPLLDDQRKIAEKLDILLNEVKRLELIYKLKMEHLSNLKQSILQKAFSGELTSSLSRTTQEAAE